MKSGYLIATSWLVAASAAAFPVLDGQIMAGEGWIHLTEDPYAGPASGGLGSASDLSGETAAQHRWDNVLSTDSDLGSPRADVQNLFIAYNSSFLYVALEGPNNTFRSWNPLGEQGDLYIAIDARGVPADTANDFLVANDGHRSFHNVNDPQAVDFYSWQPTQFIGVDWVDNGGGFASGQGYANIEQAGSHTVSAGEGHYTGDGGFEWAVGLDAQNRGVYEFQVPWSDVGFAGLPAPGTPIRLAMYTTAEFDFYDVYDSGPGFGQPGPFEEIGDNPGDIDTGVDDDVTGTFGASDGLGDPGADNGSINGSFPGSNYVDPNTFNYNATPGVGDEIDTIEEYLQYTIIPEPASLAMLILGGLGVFYLRRRLR